MRETLLKNILKMTKSKYQFIRTELRVLQNTVDNEQFLNLVADMIGHRDEKIEEEFQRGYDEGFEAAIMKERG